MKIRVTFKTPDAIDSAARELAIAEVGEHQDDREDIERMSDEYESAKKKLQKWISGGEYLTVEFDLDAMTATVIEKKLSTP